uniref:Uncharacterized protein n=1 Tax=Anguilla anguilla TaxID=7936 RepID=A0A0E9XMY6_ANGAN
MDSLLFSRSAALSLLVSILVI